MIIIFCGEGGSDLLCWKLFSYVMVKTHPPVRSRNGYVCEQTNKPTKARLVTTLLTHFFVVIPERVGVVHPRSVTPSAERRVVVVNKCPQGNVTGIETMTVRTPVGSQPHDDRVLVQYTQRIAFGSVERVGLGSVCTRLTYEMIIQPQERIRGCPERAVECVAPAVVLKAPLARGICQCSSDLARETRKRADVWIVCKAYVCTSVSEVQWRERERERECVCVCVTQRERECMTDRKQPQSHLDSQGGG